MRGGRGKGRGGRKEREKGRGKKIKDDGTSSRSDIKDARRLWQGKAETGQGKEGKSLAANRERDSGPFF